MKAIQGPENTNKFCGPAVIAAIVGKTTGEVEQVIQQQTTRSVITYMTFSEVMSCLKYYGRLSVLSKYKSSLYSFLTTFSQNGRYILMVPGHFIAIEILPNGERFFLDNHTRKPINAFASARLMNPVGYILKVL